MNALEKRLLSDRQMSSIAGGKLCGCACCEEEGSTALRDSATSDNHDAVNTKVFYDELTQKDLGLLK